MKPIPPTHRATGAEAKLRRDVDRRLELFATVTTFEQRGRMVEATRCEGCEGTGWAKAGDKLNAGIPHKPCKGRGFITRRLK